MKKLIGYGSLSLFVASFLLSPVAFSLWGSDEPWRVGKGLHINLWKRTFQIGVCHKQHYKNSIDGELSVVGGRFMETAPEEIGAW